MVYREGPETGSPPRGWGDLCILLGSCFYLLISLIAFPGVPILLGGDQVFFWVSAQRVLLGDRIYRDFFQFAAPGTDLIYLGTFHLSVRVSGFPISLYSFWVFYFAGFASALRARYFPEVRLFLRLPSSSWLCMESRSMLRITGLANSASWPRPTSSCVVGARHGYSFQAYCWESSLLSRRREARSPLLRLARILFGIDTAPGRPGVNASNNSPC